MIRKDFLHISMSSRCYLTPAFIVQTAVQESAKIAADTLQNDMDGGERPLAKICPRVAELASRLLQRDDNVCVSRFAGLSEVQRLSATVYACGPAL